MRRAQYWRTARHAAASFIALVLVLITMYAQNQSSRFTASFSGFKRSLHYDQAKAATTFGDVWRWFEQFTNSIAADTLEQIDANCGYNKPNLQDVDIGGTQYKLFDPQYQFGNCENFKYLNDPNEKVYLSDTGNHELKTVGVFTGRSTSALSADGEKIVQNNEVAELDAVSDARILEICNVSPWDRPCVLKDGFRDSTVTTLKWGGEVIDGYYAFNVDGSRARILTPSEDKTYPEFRQYEPCFNNVSGVLTSPKADFPLDTNNPMQGYGECHQTWVTPGYEVRKHCLNSQVTQAEAKYAFMISILNYTTLTEMRNLLYGCEAVLGLDSDALKGAFVIDDEFVENSLENEKLHGLFIKTDSQGAWIEDSSLLLEQMKFAKLIDRSTRAFNVIAITRNDGAGDLYYSKVSFNFKMLVDGKIILRMEASYIPMVQYIYGLDDYPWSFREIVIFESLFALMLLLFTIREIRQDYKQFLLFVAILSIRSSAKISDIFTGGSEHSVAETNNHENENGNADSTNKITSNGSNEEKKKDTGNTGDDDIESGKNESQSISNLEIGANNSDINEENAEGEEQNHDDSNLHGPENATTHPFIFSSTTMTSIGEMTLIPDDSNWYNILDWFTIVMGILTINYRVVYVQLCYDAVQFLESLDEEPEPGSVLSRHEDSFGVTLEQFRDIEDCENSIFLIYMVLVLVCIIQFFRYLEFDARFGIVARTLRQSMWVLLPVLVVFTTILSTYAVMGTIIYGKNLSEWSTFYNSLGSLFLLILGEFEGYPRMRGVSSSLTGLFFWSFVTFVILVLFNMVLAIILTVYDETYKQITLEANEKASVEDLMYNEFDKKES